MSSIKILGIVKDKLNSNNNISRYLLSMEVAGEEIQSHLEIEYEPIRVIMRSDLDRSVGQLFASLTTRVIDDFDKGKYIKLPLEIEANEEEEEQCVNVYYVPQGLEPHG
jgi:hypothetical protein